MRKEFNKPSNTIIGLVFKKSGRIFNFYKNVGDARRALAVWKEIKDDLEIVEYSLNRVKTIDK